MIEEGKMASETLMFKSQVGEKEVRKERAGERFLRKPAGGRGEWKDEGKRQRQERRWIVVS